MARIIASSARKIAGTKFVQLSATTAGIADVKEAVAVAKNHKSLLKKKTLLFIDEIHRFNKLQQVYVASYMYRYTHSYSYMLTLIFSGFISPTCRKWHHYIARSND